MKRLAAALLVCAVAIAQTPADSLKANLTYLASDELEGRGTPSRGLELAADFIAKKFQEAGLQPAASDGSYFQTAKFGQVTENPDGFNLTFKAGAERLSIAKDEARVRSLTALDLTGQPVLRLPENGTIPPVAGLIVAADASRYADPDLLAQLQSRKPALILIVGKSRQSRPGSRPTLEALDTSPVPVIRVSSNDAAKFVSQPDLLVSVHTAAPEVKEIPLRNVAGILPGSDPALRGQYVLLTAHYDHLGRTPKGIFHGANDNGSGTVSVIEIARELAALPTRPKRSIVFITFFGEEEGLLGSDYYGRHPLVPLKDTVADINLEQIGRTDEKTGSRPAAFAFTGPSYTNIPAIMAEAAKPEGVKVYKREDADSFFNRSDNYAFAREGVVDTTIAVAFEYPDYHALGDTVDKIDFPNMAKVDRALAAGIERIADDPVTPKWTGKPRL